MVTASEPLKLGNCTYKLCVGNLYVKELRTWRWWEAGMFVWKFNVVGICTNESDVQNWIIHFSVFNFYFLLASPKN